MMKNMVGQMLTDVEPQFSGFGLAKTTYVPVHTSGVHNESGNEGNIYIYIYIYISGPVHMNARGK